MGNTDWSKKWFWGTQPAQLRNCYLERKKNVGEAGLGRKIKNGCIKFETFSGGVKGFIYESGSQVQGEG